MGNSRNCVLSYVLAIETNRDYNLNLTLWIKT